MPQQYLNPPPAEQTDLSRKGRDLLPGRLSLQNGLMTNISDFLRPSSAAKILRNVNMLKRNVWTSRYAGWTPHIQTAFLSGAPFSEFGDFYDSLGNETLMAKVGTKILSYKTAQGGVPISCTTNSTKTQVIVALPENGLDTATTAATAMTALLNNNTILQAQGIYATSSAGAITITYPIADTLITSFKTTGSETLTTTGASTGGSVVLTFGGTFAAGDVLTLNTLLTGTQVIAAQLTALINANTVLQSAFVNATVSGSVITLTYLNAAANTYAMFVTFSSAGSTAETATISNLANGTTTITITGTTTNFAINDVITLTIAPSGPQAIVDELIPILNNSACFLDNSIVASVGTQANTLIITAITGTTIAFTGGSNVITVTNATVGSTTGNLARGSSITGSGSDQVTVGFYGSVCTPGTTILFKATIAGSPGGLNTALNLTYTIPNVTLTTTLAAVGNSYTTSGGTYVGSTLTVLANATTGLGEYQKTILTDTLAAGLHTLTFSGSATNAPTVGDTCTLQTPVITGLTSGNIPCMRMFSPATQGNPSYMAVVSPELATPYMIANISTGGASLLYLNQSTAATITLTGTVAAGNTIIITFYSKSLNGGVPVIVSYTSGDTSLTDLAAGLTTQINDNQILIAAGLTATSSAGVITVSTIAPIIPAATIVVGVDGSSVTSAVAQISLTGIFGKTAAPMQPKTYSYPTLCEPFLGRMIYSGFSTPDTTRDVLITNYGHGATCTQNPTLLATDGGTFQVPAALGPIVGIKAFKLSNQTNDQVALIGCKRGIAVILGTDATNFAMLILTQEYGIWNNRTWVQLQNDVYFMATDGVRRFSSLTVNANLLNASLTYLLQDLINQIDPTNGVLMHATHHRSTKEVQFWFAITGDSTENQHAIVMNYNTDASDANPESIIPVWSTRDTTAVACAIEYQGAFFGGGYTGLLQQHYTASTYNLLAVPFQIVFSLAAPQSTAENCGVKLSNVITEGPNAAYLVNGYSLARVIGGGLSRVQQAPQNYSINIGQPNTTTLGSWVLGTSALPSDHYEIAEFIPVGSGRAWEFEILGNQANHVIDLVCLDYMLSVGGTRQ